MLCYECCQAGTNSEAVGSCHHCSAALCWNHAHSVADPVTASYPVSRTIVLPLQARLILCQTCLSALHQEHEQATAKAG